MLDINGLMPYLFRVKKKKQTKPHIHSSNSAQRDSNSSSEKPCGGANMPKVSSKEASNLLEGTMTLDVADNRRSRLSSNAILIGDEAKQGKQIEEFVDEDSDSECQVVGTSSSVTTPPAYATQILPQTSQAAEDALIAKFRALNVVRLAEACRLMRFTVGSCRKIVQGIVVDIVGSLRIVDGMWTMKVTVQDESIDKLMCLVDNRLLTSLIGLTPKEAMEIRSSSDVGRRQDGQRRLAAVEAQLKRLDLLLELELFSSGRADPIIRSIQTLVQALDVL
ncbi:hypothetical protein NECAME_08040 [Necator americanus]|uniref:RecQ-mediated genome instability protein 1 C-terminal OB-fold domain-containing protein n=1 Tax=Necator americanus TaxID=51031 RepID=W2TKN3_NECAM|nr:hypothetical protein NECAME_08040 [Necator americanus]ETN82328.1 hypothetical protein NECAME_08040 [Necator americanus]